MGCFASIYKDKYNFTMKFSALNFSLILSLLAASCGVYTPQGSDIPLIDHRDMVNLGGSISLAHAQGNLSVGITDHLATAISCSYGFDHKYYAQGMAGWYRPIGSGVLELYGGFGWGHGKQYFDPDPGEGAIGNYQLYYAQADYGWNNLANKHLDIGFALKAGLLHSDLQRIDPSIIYLPGLMPSNHLLLEPTAQVRVGWEHFKFSIALAFCYLAPRNRWDSPALFPYDPLNLTLGLTIKLKK